MKFASMILIFFSTVSLFAQSIDQSTAKLKFCLAAIYKAETSFHKKHNEYTSKLLSLEFNELRSCANLGEINIKTNGKNDFKAQISNQKNIATIDQNKMIVLKME